ncbi:MAG TPA: cyclic nucleotide-binding domain-containing protein [Alphaproteobacteria bacterium]
MREIGICDALSSAEIARLEAIKTTTRLRPGDVILREGEPADHLFNVKKGAIKVYKLLADGRCQITSFLFPGDFLGLAHDQNYAFTAEALTDVEACRFARTQYEAVVQACPTLERRLLATASNELVAAQDQMLLLGRKSATEKVASFLLMLSKRAVKRGEPASPITLPMKRADISDYLGLTIETVSRVLTRLKKSGVIRILNPGRIDLLRPSALSDLAAGPGGA